MSCPPLGESRQARRPGFNTTWQPGLDTTPDFAAVAGRPPHAFAYFARDYAAYLGGASPTGG
jgi:hypothetical protein